MCRIGGRLSIGMAGLTARGSASGGRGEGKLAYGDYAGRMFS